MELDELVEAIILEMTEEVILNQEQLMEEFQTFYHDGNSFITTVEHANPMAKMGQTLSFRELTEMFREVNVNGDDLISFSEFAAVMVKSAADFLGLSVI